MIDRGDKVWLALVEEIGKRMSAIEKKLCTRIPEEETTFLRAEYKAYQTILRMPDEAVPLIAGTDFDV
jgi:hypothetical protein